MILTKQEIIRNVENGKITIDPFDEAMLGTISYDYHIDSKLLEIDDIPIDPKQRTEFREINFSDEGYILSPHKVYLANTLEDIGSSKFVPLLIGNASLGRLGLFLQITADLGNLGAKHKWTLELKAVQPIKIYPGMRVGQVSFWQTNGATDIMYKGKYDKFSEAKSSEIYREFIKGEA